MMSNSRQSNNRRRIEGGFWSCRDCLASATATQVHFERCSEWRSTWIGPNAATDALLRRALRADAVVAARQPHRDRSASGRTVRGQSDTRSSLETDLDLRA